MAGHGSKLARKQEAAIEALLSPSNRSLTEAAQAIGINVKTLRRWLKLPDFNAAYLQARREAVAQSHARLQQGSSLAATLLFKTIGDGTARSSDRVHAAKAVLDLATRTLELDDILLRLARLETDQRKYDNSQGKSNKTEYKWEGFSQPSDEDSSGSQASSESTTRTL